MIAFRNRRMYLKRLGLFLPVTPYITASVIYKKWITGALWEAKTSGYVDYPWKYPVYIEFVFYRGTRHRYDFINVAQAPLDVLVKVGVLRDDDMTSVIPLGFEHFYDKENPRVEMYISEQR